MQYTNFNIFIFATISINDNWYKRFLKNKFEKNMRDKMNIYYNELIRRREYYYRKRLNHNNEILFMKINSTEYRKRKNFKNE